MSPINYSFTNQIHLIYIYIYIYTYIYIYIYLHINSIWLQITYEGWYAINPTHRPSSTWMNAVLIKVSTHAVLSFHVDERGHRTQGLACRFLCPHNQSNNDRSISASCTVQKFVIIYNNTTQISYQTFEFGISLYLAISTLVHFLMVLFTNPSAREGYDTRSIFKRSLTGLNSEFSFS